MASLGSKELSRNHALNYAQRLVLTPYINSYNRDTMTDISARGPKEVTLCQPMTTIVAMAYATIRPSVLHTCTHVHTKAHIRLHTSTHRRVMLDSCENSRARTEVMALLLKSLDSKQSIITSHFQTNHNSKKRGGAHKYYCSLI